MTAPLGMFSDAGMVGGSTPTPGEISLAHHGILFLDGLPEFHRRSLEVRHPLPLGRAVIHQPLASSFRCRCRIASGVRPVCRAASAGGKVRTRRSSSSVQGRPPVGPRVPGAPRSSAGASPRSGGRPPPVGHCLDDVPGPRLTALRSGDLLPAFRLHDGRVAGRRPWLARPGRGIWSANPQEPGLPINVHSRAGLP